MPRLNPPARAVNPIGIEPATPWEKEQQKLLGVRVGRTYAKPAQPTATTKQSAAVAGTKVGGGGRISGGGGVIPTSRPLPAKP